MLRTDKEKVKFIVMTILIGFASAGTYYFHVVLGQEIIFTHFYYIPVILAALWWKRKGLLVAVLLSIILLSSHLFDLNGVITISDSMRSLMFVVIASVVVVLSERTEKTNEEIRESEEKYRDLFENSIEAVFTVDIRGNFTSANDALVSILGYEKEEIIGSRYIKYGNPEVVEEVLKAYNHLYRTGEPIRNFVYETTRKDGEVRTLEVYANVIREGNEIVGFQGTLRDITERKRSEERIAHLNRLLKSIRNVNQLIVREKDKKILLQQACEILVEVSGYLFVWIGMIEEGHKKVIPVAQWGFEDGYLEKITVTWDDKKAGRGPTGTVIKTKKPCVFKDILNNPEYAPWKKEAEKRGYRSCIAVPLVHKETIHGVLNVYSENIDYFDEEEVKLLEEVAQDIAFAFSSIEMEEGRKRTEEALRLSEEKYRTILENIDDGYFEVDIAGNYTFFNDSMCNILGYSRDEILGMNNRKYMDKETAKEVYKVFNEVFRTKKTRRSFDWELIRKDKKRIYVSTSVTPIFDKEKNVVGFRGIARDITEKRRSEELIRQSEEKYRNFFETSKDVVYLSSLDERFIDINPAGEELFGYTRDKLIELNIIELYRDKNERKAFQNTIMEEGFIKDYGITYKKKDTSLIHCLETSTVRTDIDGNITGYQGIIRDITEKKKAEEALLASEEKYRDFVENAIDMIFTIAIDIDGNFLEVNKALLKETGYNADEVIGKSFSSFLYSEDESVAFEAQKEVQRGEAHQFEMRAKKKDGNIGWYSLTMRPIFNSEGSVITAQGIARNITDRKKMEEQLIQSEKLSSLGGVLSGVAHELNNPLTAIIGNAQLLVQREIPTVIKDKLDTIQRESIRCTKIVGGLLDFAREHKPERRMISVNDVIMESYKLREYELRVDDVDIKLDLSEDIPKTYADPYQLQQVFTNLINNAHDALLEKSGGILNIRSYRRDKKILIEFEDSGPGIPKKYIRKIFDPFFTTKEVGKGTGLGLSVAYGIINEHDGRIDIESKTDRGTKFTVEFPIVKGVVERKEIEIERPKRPEGTKTVLVVEDEESLRDFISLVLSDEGYVVETVGRGEDAIELLKEGGYDAIISDMKMPGMSGQNLYAFVQKEYPELADRMLFITGDVLGRETQNFLKVTEAKYIEKPFEIDVLLRGLSEVLAE